MKKVTLIFLFCASIFLYLRQEKDSRLLMVLSDSMKPTIQKGDLILIKKFSTYKKGDIMSFKPDNSPNTITHRIVGIKKENNRYFFTTKGDNNEFEDPYIISDKEILGKVIFQVPFLTIFDQKPFLTEIIFLISMCLGGLLLGKLAGKILKDV